MKNNKNIAEMLTRRWYDSSHFLKSHLFIIFVILLYVALAVYYMAPAITSCSNTVLSFGDSTAGPIWKFSVLPHAGPNGSYETLTNYPFGENVNNAVGYGSILQSSLVWIASKIAGPVCGYNLFNVAGFIGTALVIFAFIRWLTRNKWIALLAGYAASFTPYFQAKVGVHPSYGYALFITLVIWTTMLLWQRYAWKYRIAFAAAIAALFYWDPYFSLLGVIAAISTFAGLLLVTLRQRQWQKIRSIILPFVTAITLAVILITPLVYVKIHYNAQINNFVSNSRNAIKFDAQIYSTRPVEYLLPAENNPIITKLAGMSLHFHKVHHYSNAAEYQVGLSLTMIGVVLVFLATIIWKKLSKRRLLATNRMFVIEPAYIAACSLAVFTIAFLFSLPPIFLGHHMPTYYLTNYITIWRVFSRLYVDVNIGLVVFFSLALAYFSTQFGRKLNKVLYVAIFLLIAVEYQAYGLTRPTWSYQTDIPKSYLQIRDNKGVKVVAEYPLDEPAQTDLPTAYFTYQTVYKKSMLDSAIAGSPQAILRNSIRDLSDPQTIPVLRGLGVDTVITHGAPMLSSSQLKLLYADMDSHMAIARLSPMYVYSVLPGPKASFVEEPYKGFDDPKYVNPVSLAYVAKAQSQLRLENLPRQNPAQKQVCFDVSTDNGVTIDLRLSADGQVAQTYRVGPEPIRVQFAVGKADFVDLSASESKATLVLDDLGCE